MISFVDRIEVKRVKSFLAGQEIRNASKASVTVEGKKYSVKICPPNDVQAKEHLIRYIEQRLGISEEKHDDTK